METFGENLRKLILAGIGAAAATAERSQALMDELVQKGELTVAQGKVLNEELKHCRNQVKPTEAKSAGRDELQALAEEMRSLTPDQIGKLRKQIADWKASAAPCEKEGTDGEKE